MSDESAGHIDQTILDCLIEPGEFGPRFCRPPFQFGDILAAFTTRGGIIFGLRAIKDRCTTSNSATVTIAGISMMACVASGGCRYQ